MLNNKSAVDVQSFARAVREEARHKDTSELSVYAAIGKAVDGGWADNPADQERIKSCCFLAREIDEASFASPDQPEQVESAAGEDGEEGGPEDLLESLGPPGPEVLVTSDELREFLRPQVEELREKIFESAEPKFKSIEEAVEWIKEEGSVSPRDRSRLFEAEVEANKHLTALAAELGLSLDGPPVTIASRLLHYPEAGRTRRVGVPAGSRLIELADFAKSAARQTGFSEAGITAHVLTGVPILLSRMTLGRSTFFPGPRPTEYTITVRAHNPTAADFRAAFTGFFKKGRRVVQVKEIDWKLCREVRSRGGEPTTKKKKWWKKTGEAIGFEGKGRGDAARMRWRRLQEKLKGVPPERLLGVKLGDEPA